MSPNQIAARRSARHQRRQNPLERIGAFLERDNEGSNADIIRLMRLTFFRDVDELQKSGTVKLPK